MLLFVFISFFILSIKTNEYEIITINLQGKSFETSRQTLYQIPYFKDLSVDLDKSTVFYMDRSAHIFKHILAWAVDNNYPFPYKYINEADFYNIKRQNINY
jgi:hypothetical protein